MIYQWIYSYSCWNRPKHLGDEPMRGFGTFSWTEGLDVKDIEELERRCSGYNYPMDYNIPPRPTQDEIDRLLPVAFYSFTLASGRRALVRTRYVGECFYDKRWGAIISHGLILDEGEGWQSYPMEYFDSPVFWNELPQNIREEAIGYKDRRDCPPPPYLTALKQEDIQLQGKYTPEGVATRMAESPRFAKMLASLLKAYLTTKTDVEPLCISAPHNDVPWLFAGLTMAFPMEMSCELNFSTYLSDKMPMDNEVGRWYQVAAVEKRNCVLDLEELPETDDDKWYIDALFANRKRIMEFLQNFTGLTIHDIPCAVMLFRFLRENSLLSEEDMQRTRKLLLEHGDSDVRKEYLEVLASGRGVPEKFSDSWLSEVFALVSDYEELRPLCYDLFLKQRQHYQGDTLDYFSKMAERYPKEITVLWLEEYAAHDLSTSGLMFTFLSLCKNGSSKELDTPAWAFLFGDKTKDKADWNKIITIASEKFADCLFSIRCYCPDKKVQEKVFEHISQDFDQTMDFAEKAIARGKEDIAKSILQKHLSKEQKKHKDGRPPTEPLDVLKQLLDSLEKTDRNFAQANFWDFFSCINSRIKTIDKDSLAWLLDKKNNVPQTSVEAFLKDIDTKIKFPTGKDSTYLEVVERFFSDDVSKEFRVRRIGIVAWFLKVLENGKKANEANDIIKELVEFDNTYRSLSAEEQLIFCRNLLPIIVDRTDDKLENVAIGQHRDILLFFSAATSNHIREHLAQKYVELVGGIVQKRNISEVDVRFIAGMKCALGELGDNELRKLILAEFANQVFSKFTDKELESAKDVLGLQTSVEKRNWDELTQEVKGANSFFSKLKSVAKSLFKRG